MKGYIAWDQKGNPLFAIIDINADTDKHTAINKGNLTISNLDVDNTSEEELIIENDKIREVI